MRLPPWWMRLCLELWPGSQGNGGQKPGCTRSGSGLTGHAGTPSQDSSILVGLGQGCGSCRRKRPGQNRQQHDWGMGEAEMAQVEKWGSQRALAASENSTKREDKARARLGEGGRSLWP